MTDTTNQFKTQLPRNLSLQVLSFVVQFGIGIWLVPYLVTHLGRAAYGLIPIAGIMTQYVSLISNNISVSVNRFLTIALQRGDVEEVNRIFNTAFFSYLAIAVIQVPILGLLIYYAKYIFTIPDELYGDAMILLSCSAMGFLINLVCSVFSVPIYANNRLDISRGIDIGRQVLRLVGVLALFLTFGPALRYVGYIDLVLSITTCCITVAIGKRLARIMTLDFSAYDWCKVKELMSMGWWVFVSHMGFLLYLRTDVWVCNRFVGAEAAGDYAALQQWPQLIRVGGNIISGVIAPMTMIYFARGEMTNLVRLSKLSVRVLSLFMAIPISALCIFSAPLLGLWLGESYARLSPLIIIMLCPLVVGVGTSPLLSMKTTVNKVKWPGLATLVIGVVNLFLAIVFAKCFNWGVYGVAIASAAAIIVRNALFMPLYGAAVLDQPWYTFLTPILSGVFCLAVMVLLGYAVSRFIQPETWLQLLLVGIALGTAGLGVAWFGLSKRDRRVITELMPLRFRNIGISGAQR